MRGRTLIPLIALGAGIALLPDVAGAQLSPQGVLGGITRPFRQALGHFRHFPRGHHRRTAIESRASAPAPSRPSAGTSKESSTVAGVRLGWVGPPAWPNAYEDLVGFTFWPDDYASRFRARGFDVIADTITGRLDVPRPVRTATTGAAVRERCRQRAVRRALWRYFKHGQQLADHSHRTDLSTIRHPTCLA